MISIVVPCYNCEKTLLLCVNSILNQSYKSFEVVLVDDGSTDATGSMCDRLMREDERIVTVHQENRGLMAAWKRGVREAEGDYIIFCDSDDWLENDLLERITLIINGEQPDMITYGVKTDYSDGTFLCLDNYIHEGIFEKEEIEKEILPRYFCYNGLGTMAILPTRCNKAIKKDLLLNNMSLLKDSISIGEDDLTSFAILLDTQRLYHIKNYYPYHYCRKIGSMLGNYNADAAGKFVAVKEELYHIAEIKGYPFIRQIDINFGENILLVLKKIMADMGYDLKTIKEQLEKTCDIKEVGEFLNNRELLKEFGIKERIMAKLIVRKMYGICTCLTTVADKTFKVLRRNTCRK